LGEIKDPRVVEPLIAALKDTDANVRRRAFLALGDVKDPLAVEPLIAALKDTDIYVRHNAADALGKIKDLRAVELRSTLRREYTSKWIIPNAP
jgi:HEAT repeat protein